MRAQMYPSIALALLACAPWLLGCDDPTPPVNDGGCTDGWQDALMAEGVDDVIGDTSCLSDTPRNVDPACVGDVTMEGTTVDHQSRDAVGSIEVRIYASDDVTSSVDDTVTSDEAGAFSTTMQSCTAWGYRTARGDDSAAPTIGLHRIKPPEDPITHDFRSVSRGTLSIIGIALGVTVEPEYGIVFGKTVDCNGEDALANVQVILRDAECQLPANSEYAMAYTSNEVPDPFLRATSEDGFYFAMNVPPGEWIVDMFATDGTWLGSAPVVVEADTITLADINVGREDGIDVPVECTACE